jgi:hypothetical protein
MNNVLHTVEETAQLIAAKKNLLVAGDESLLAQLPAGSWVGGTIPYFIAENGGVTTRDKIFVTELPASVEAVRIAVYDESTIDAVYNDASRHQLSFIIIPANCATHLTFATKAPTFASFAARPLVGWIAGVHLSDLGKVAPKAFNGASRQAITNGAVVMHMRLAPHKVADVGICNLFSQGDGDSIAFSEPGFVVTDALINGSRANFADYLKEKAIDTRLPLVADYYGAMVNISIQGVDAVRQSVSLYSPVFAGVQYKFASPVNDYAREFVSLAPHSDGIVFSCNCILNYLYSGLEGKRTGEMTGPATFGEIAYQLLNQTLVYVKIEDAVGV